MTQSRITPAGAGKTFDCLSAQVPIQDHPRRCGENLPAFAKIHSIAGSPPQVRGKRASLRQAASSPRITPAGAGKTFFRMRALPKKQDHPRRCGENHKLTVMCSDGKGSPPQVRGKPTAVPDTFPRHGITPAGAGKTRLARDGFKRRKDHPRRCGENLFPPFISFSNVGSPPQVRGKLFQITKFRTLDGITPAGAGKTAALGGAVVFAQDHPRRCGEN